MFCLIRELKIIILVHYIGDTLGPSVIITFTTVIYARICFNAKKAAINKNYDQKFENYGLNSNDNTGPGCVSIFINQK